MILILAVAAIASAEPRATPVGFDHLMHDRNLIVRGGEALPCARCHEVRAGKLIGKPGHTTCFGACHGAPPKASDTLERKKVCTACHAEAALTAHRFPLAYPPYTIDPDFNLAVGHKQHAQVACSACHPATRPAPHLRCAGCHDGTRAGAMDHCTSCHPPAIGKPQPPELAALRNSVAAVFSHGKHATRGGAGKECTTCHAAIRTTDDSELPRPTVKDCAASGCHDGKAAFATTASCVRCHDRPPPDRFDVARPDKRFRHAGPHQELIAGKPCGACHALEPRGETIVANHATCTGGACHTDDFGRRTPEICGACHTATEPWRHLAVDRSFPDETEFGATLDHRKHPGACRTCHALDTRTTQLRLRRGHAACTGAACHAVTGGVAPQLSACNGCHRIGLDAARSALRAADPWSVRLTFDHASHHETTDHRELACTACHADLAADDILGLRAPEKPTCAPCHDGHATFSLTGTTCSRCHVGVKR